MKYILFFVILVFVIPFVSACSIIYVFKHEYHQMLVWKIFCCVYGIALMLLAIKFILSAVEKSA